MTKRDYFLLGVIAALGLWVMNISSDLEKVTKRLDNTMEDVMEMKIEKWDADHIGEDPDPLGIFRKESPTPAPHNSDPLDLFDGK